MGELNYIILMPVASLLFMLGGYKWKWMRRYLLPVIFGVFAILNGFVWWQAVCLSLSTGIVFCLPYGDSIDWTIRIIVACAYALSLTVIGFTWWQFFLVPIFLLLFWLSKNKETEKLVPWKIWEGSIGFLMGLNVAKLLCR